MQNNNKFSILKKLKDKTLLRIFASWKQIDKKNSEHYFKMI